MRQRWIGLRVLVTVCCIIGWWGVLYPELIMTADTYSAVEADGAVQDADDVVEWENDEDFYRQLLTMDRSRLRFGSRLYMLVSEYLQKARITE